MTKRRFGPLLIGCLLIASFVEFPNPAYAFDIDKAATLLPVNPHGGIATHEQITAEAIVAAGKPYGSNFIINVQRGVENTDITHMFDSESHFDNASVSAGVGFQPAFDTITNRLNAASAYAAGNPQVRNPKFRSFREIAGDAKDALKAVVQDSKCLKSWRCPTTEFALRQVATFALYATVLAVNPNPDPHTPTHARSPFGPTPGCTVIKGICNLVSGFTATTRGAIGTVERHIDWALGPHRDRPFDSMVKPKTLRRVQEVKDEIRAYRAFQELGHALHATQDFFAHSTYVEEMTDTFVEDPIALSDPNPSTGLPWKPGEIQLPPDFAQFNLAGLESIMGPDRFEYLETGNVRTRWLGEPNVCSGRNLFNPAFAIKFPSIKLLTFHFPKLSFSLSGGNPEPEASFEYCHYANDDWEGVNKDHPCPNDTTNQTRPEECDEPSHVNFYYAKAAATQMSTLLLKAWPGY